MGPTFFFLHSCPQYTVLHDQQTLFLQKLIETLLADYATFSGRLKIYFFIVTYMYQSYKEIRQSCVGKKLDRLCPLAESFFFFVDVLKYGQFLGESDLIGQGGKKWWNCRMTI
jgi:hypothetical protein